MKRYVACLGVVTALWSAPIHANPKTGFAITDLRQVSEIAFAVPGNRYSRSVAANRLTLYCRSCRDTQSIDIVVGKSTDGTEGRFRSGETTIAMMQGICKSRQPNCTMEAIEINGAIGWVSRVQLGPLQMSTSILFKNGDMLTIRSLAGDRQTAFDNGRAAREQIAPSIIGRN
jgi:hypothetical protein